MLLKDKTASSIKRKVQLAKSKVDKNAAEATKILAFAETEADELSEDIRVLETELSDARFAQEDAEADLVVAAKVAGLTAGKKAQVMDLIAQFEADLEALL